MLTSPLENVYGTPLLELKCKYSLENVYGTPSWSENVSTVSLKKEVKNTKRDSTSVVGKDSALKN